MQISQQTEITIPQIPITFDISSLNLKLNKKDSLIYLTEKKAYTPIASCVCEHIITTSTLTASQKLYYILADCLALVNLNLGGKREVKLSSNKWAKRLGCSKSTILNLQEYLEEKGYFDVQRGKNEFKQDNRNIITPTMPDDIFNTLEAAENRTEETLPFDTSKGCKRSYLDKAKLFIPINYQLLLLVFSSSKLNSTQKITWLDFYIRSYKLYIANLNSDKNDIDEVIGREKFLKKLEKYKFNDISLDEINNNLRNFINIKLKEKNLTISELSKKIGISEKLITNFLDSPHESLSSVAIFVLADYSETSIDKMIGRLS